MQINSKSIKIPNNFSNRAFNEEVSSFRAIFLAAGEPTVKSLSLLEMKKYSGDFHGLLSSLGIEPQFHQIITQLNGYPDTTAYVDTDEEIMLPDLNAISSFISSLV